MQTWRLRALRSYLLRWSSSESTLNASLIRVNFSVASGCGRRRRGARVNSRLPEARGCAPGVPQGPSGRPPLAPAAARAHRLVHVRVELEGELPVRGLDRLHCGARRSSKGASPLLREARRPPTSRGGRLPARSGTGGEGRTVCAFVDAEHCVVILGGSCAHGRLQHATLRSASPTARKQKQDRLPRGIALREDRNNISCAPCCALCARGEAQARDICSQSCNSCY